MAQCTCRRADRTPPGATSHRSSSPIVAGPAASVDGRYDAPVNALSESSGPVPAACVARVTLARPEVHNAFDASLIAELRRRSRPLPGRTPPALRVVVLAGDGPSFCAGADVAWMRAAMALDVEGNEQDAMAMADMFETIDTCPVPVIVRVHGAALGGGMGLCAVGRPRLRRERHAVRLHRDAPGHPSGGDLTVRHREDRRVPCAGVVPGRSPFDAIRAQRIGLVHELVEGEAALDLAVDLAVAVIPNPGKPSTVCFTLKLLRKG